MNDLLASSGTLENLRQSIVRFYCGSTVTLEPITKKEWAIHTGKGLCAGVTVVKKGKRYRFEMRSLSD